MSKAPPQTESESLAYAVVRSPRTTMDIIIERDGSVLVRAPEWADDGEIARLVATKELWIYQGLAEWRDLNATRLLREFKNGEGFMYLGRSYRLTLSAEGGEPVRFRDGRFALSRGLIESGDAAGARSAFQNFYTAKGHTRLRKRVAYFAPKVGVTPSGVEVRELGHRWGSCSPDGNLAFHWKCVMAPQSVIDYVVVHELCHLHERDHTDAFWNEVDKVMPDFQERKNWLRQHGAGLDI